jgi:hypothetical protein
MWSIDAPVEERWPLVVGVAWQLVQHQQQSKQQQQLQHQRHGGWNAHVAVVSQATSRRLR